MEKLKVLESSIYVHQYSQHINGHVNTLKKYFSAKLSFLDHINSDLSNENIIFF